MSTPPQPPPPPFQPEPDRIEIDTRGPARRSSLSNRVSGEYQRAKQSATKLPKFFLLAATVIWPIAAAGWGQVRHSWSMAEGTKIEGETAFRYLYENRMRNMNAASFEMRADFARWEGMKHVTIIYVVVAIGCLAWWFYVKD